MHAKVLAKGCVLGFSNDDPAYRASLKAQVRGTRFPSKRDMLQLKGPKKMMSTHGSPSS